MQRTRVETRTYTLADAAAVLGTSEERVLQLVEAGLPERASTLRRPGARALTFQDLVLLRNAKRLVDQAIAPARVADALRQARARHPSDRPLSTLRLETAGQQIVLREGAARVAADSGQVLLDLEVAPAPAPAHAPAPAPDVDTLFSEAQALEDRAPARARLLYAQLLARAPGHADAHVNLGRLLHEAGQLAAAQTHYRAALAARPGDATAAYNLAVALGDQGRMADAVHWYETALRSDPQLAEAHYNLATLFDQSGDSRAAIRHINEYRKLTR
jgi:tetratricopeptide (TPR) repeat protein